jgi:hypothetical protein
MPSYSLIFLFFYNHHFMEVAYLFLYHLYSQSILNTYGDHHVFACNGGFLCLLLLKGERDLKPTNKCKQLLEFPKWTFHSLKIPILGNILYT